MFSWSYFNLSTLWANSVDNIDDIFQKISFDISCKETICMKCQSLCSGKNKGTFCMKCQPIFGEKKEEKHFEMSSAENFTLHAKL